MAIIHKLHTTTSLTGLTFIMSDPTPDRYDDICECKPDSWVLDNFLKNNICLFGHRSDFAIGTWENVRVKDGALVGHLKMAPEGTSDRIDEVRRLITAGVLKSCSVGFRPLASKPRPNSAGTIYTKMELVECSLCAVGANPSALAVAKKLGTSRKTIAMVFTNDGTDSIEHQRRQAVRAKALATLQRLNEKVPGMKADIARRRQRALLEDGREFAEQHRWPSYANWRGEDL